MEMLYIRVLKNKDSQSFFVHDNCGKNPNTLLHQAKKEQIKYGQLLNLLFFSLMVQNMR